MFARLWDKIASVPVIGAIGLATLTAAGATMILIEIDEPSPENPTPIAAESRSTPRGEGFVAESEADPKTNQPPSMTVPSTSQEHAQHKHGIDEKTTTGNTESGPKNAAAPSTTVAASEPHHATTPSPSNPPHHQPKPSPPTPTTTVPTTAPPSTQAPGGGHDHGNPPIMVPPSPGGPTRLVVSQDTMVNTKLTLRPGDSIEFRNGARLMFGSGGSADWHGSPTSTWSGDGQVQNLERDVVVFGAGDIMFMPGSQPSTIKYVEIDLRPKQELGHYPLHWHLAGNSVRGTVVDGVVVKNSTNRAYVTHGSHGITIQNSIAKNIVGEAFWWDPPGSNPQGDNSHDIVWNRNLVDTVKDTPLHNNVRLAGMVLGAGKNNIANDNVILNMASDVKKDCAAYVWPEAVGGVWEFENNKAIGGNCNGIFVWQNNGDDHVVDGFTAQSVGQACIRHGAYGNNYRYINISCDEVEVLAGERGDSPGPRFQGGRIDKVIFAEHRLSGAVRFIGTSVGAIEINNGTNGCGRFLPGDYVFENTGLSFDQIQTAKVCPGTRVLINGTVREFG